MNLDSSNYEQSMQQYSSDSNKSKHVKFIVIGLIIIISIAIIGFLIINTKKKNSSALEKEILIDYAIDNPIVIEENGLYGFIDASSGKKIVEPKYTEVEGYYGDYAIVITKTDNDRNVQIINREGNVVKTFGISSVKYNSIYDFWLVDGDLYDSDFNKISNDSEYVTFEIAHFNYTSSVNQEGVLNYKDYSSNTSGVMSPTGEKIYTYPSTSAEVTKGENSITNKQRYCAVNINPYESSRKAAIINCDTGEIVLDYINKRIEAEKDNIFSIFGDSHTPEKMVYVRDNKIAYEESVDKNRGLEFYYVNDEYLRISKKKESVLNDTYYYIFATQEIVDKKPEETSPCTNAFECTAYEDGFQAKECSDDNKMGIFKKDTLVTSCDYDKISYVSSGLYRYTKEQTGRTVFLATKDNKTIVLDSTSGNELFEFNNNSISGSRVSTFIYGIDQETSKHIIYNTISNTSMEFDKNDKISIKRNYFTVEKNGVTNYYNTNFKNIYTLK